MKLKCIVVYYNIFWVYYTISLTLFNPVSHCDYKQPTNDKPQSINCSAKRTIRMQLPLRICCHQTASIQLYCWCVCVSVRSVKMYMLLLLWFFHGNCLKDKPMMTHFNCFWTHAKWVWMMWIELQLKIKQCVGWKEFNGQLMPIKYCEFCLGKQMCDSIIPSSKVYGGAN